MGPREAAELLALMRGTWPRLAPDEVANQLWLDDLVRLDSKPAVEAFRRLRNSEDRAPAWALFREAYQAQVRRFEPIRHELEAPDIPPPTEAEKARVHDLVVGLKDKLTKMPRQGKLQPRGPSRPSSDFDPFTPMLSYDEVYGEQKP